MKLFVRTTAEIIILSTPTASTMFAGILVLLSMMPMYDMLYIFGKVLGSTFQIAKKINKFAKTRASCAKSIYRVKNVCKKSCAKYDMLYIFGKPLTMPF